MQTIRQVHSACPICQSGNIREIWQVSGFRIGRCGACTVSFVLERLAPDALARFYEGSDAVAYSDENLNCLRYYYSQARGMIDSYQARPGRILDIGCSQGWFFNEMSGWECYGTEITPRDAMAAREKYGDNIFVGAFEEMPERADFFDVITFQDVLDHFIDPLEALKKAMRLLKPGGIVLIKVHDFSCLYARFAGSRFYAVIPPYHLFYFTRRALRRLVEIAGFEMVSARHIGNLLQIKTVFYRLSRNDRKSWSYRIFRLLEGTSIGRAKFVKNLHDIITVAAKKPNR